MDLLPEWAPGLHPVVVHFPIALLIAAVLFDAISLVMRRGRHAAVPLYALGAVGALVAYLTGRQAVDVVMLSGAANMAAADHADFALITVWFFGLLAALRVGLALWSRGALSPKWHALLLAVGAGGMYFVIETGTRGARLVFEYGVGVERVSELEEQLGRELARARGLSAGPKAEPNGSWTWNPGAGAPDALREAFTFPVGDPADLEAEMRGDTLLALAPRSSPVLFVYDRPLESAQIDVRMDVGAFEGSVSIVHHVRGATEYHYATITRRSMAQGSAAGAMDEVPFNPSGMRDYRVVAAGTHFRAYADGVLVTHGHGPAPAPGPVGLRLDGQGVVLLEHVDVRALR